MEYGDKFYGLCAEHWIENLRDKEEEDYKWTKIKYVQIADVQFRLIFFIVQTAENNNGRKMYNVSGKSEAWMVF